MVLLGWLGVLLSSVADAALNSRWLFGDVAVLLFPLLPIEFYYCGGCSYEGVVRFQLKVSLF